MKDDMKWQAELRSTQYEVSCPQSLIPNTAKYIQPQLGQNSKMEKMW